MKRKGADTLLGNIWWVLDPLLQMGVYVVFVAIILQTPQPDYPLFILSAILPWKWFTSSINDATSSVVSQERLIKQIQFPKIVLPVAATTAGRRRVRVRADRACRDHAVLPRPGVDQPRVHPGHRRGAVRVHARDGARGRVDQRVLPRPRQCAAAHPAAVVLPVAGPLQPVAGPRRQFFQDNPILLDIARANPFAILFEAYRAVIYGTAEGGPALPNWAALGGAARGEHRPASASRRSSSSGSSRRSPRSSDGRERTRRSARDASTRSRSPTSASATACGSAASRPCGSRSRRSSRAGRSRVLGTAPRVLHAGPRRVARASSGRTAPARARSSRSSPGSSRRPRARSTCAGTFQAC